MLGRRFLPVALRWIDVKIDEYFAHNQCVAYLGSSRAFVLLIAQQTIFAASMMVWKMVNCWYLNNKQGVWHACTE
eukprot:scaffold5778_cov71-Cylindrotheca_fusiformis.AAC.2